MYTYICILYVVYVYICVYYTHTHIYIYKIHPGISYFQWKGHSGHIFYHTVSIQKNSHRLKFKEM